MSVTCPIGELETPQDSHHVLYFHVGQPVQLTCRLNGRERHGGIHHPGDLCVLPAGVSGQWDMEARADSLVLRLSPLLVTETARTLRLRSAFAQIAPAMRVRDPHLEYIGWLLRAEREAGYPYGRLFVDSVAAAIAARLLRRSDYTTASPRDSRRQLPKWRLHAVCEYIHANLDRDLSLAELAGIAGFSASHFKPLFRQATGLPVHRYVVECRVERARQLILRGNQSMGDIALETGFTHQSHMVRCLRRVLGISAAEVVSLGRQRAPFPLK
ncbi:MAG TPA: AraC family transcriptional regulator [Steroidobacteraceae bacterium]|nr:AraC family transcriptional regulator [Steroidobacteraceae bacterium]